MGQSIYAFFFFDWAFNYPKHNGRKFAKEMYDLIPLNTDIIVTHGPPRGILDQGKDGGCEQLLNAINIIKPKLWCGGHFHTSGVQKHGNTLFVNAAMAGGREQKWKTNLITNKPFIALI